MRKINIKRVAYELYKQAWIDSHTTPDARLDELREYYLYCKECVENGDKPETHRNALEESGYPGGMLYVCYKEFCGAEYLVPEYIEQLLKNDELIALYRADRGIKGRFRKEAR